MKNKIRKEIIKRREDLSREEVLRKSKIISEEVIEDGAYKKTENILIYIDFKGEVCTKFIIEDALKRGKNIFIPKIKEGEMVFYKFEGYDELESGYFGISEPKEDGELFDGNCEFIVITPAVAFDKANNRIGFGKGFYDRFFKRVNPVKKIGVCYDFQMVESCFSDKNDERVDVVYVG